MRELPAGWEWKRVHEIGEVQLGRQRSPEHANGPHMRPYLRVANVFDGWIDYSDVLEMNFTPSEFKKFSLQPGDVLLNEGQSLELVGRSAVYDGPPGICFQNTLIRFRPKEVIPQFAQAVFKMWLSVGEFQKISKQTTSIAHLGAGRFANMSFPLPPIGEQKKIVEALRTIDEYMFANNKVMHKEGSILAGVAEFLVTESTTQETLLGDHLAENPRNGYSPKEVDHWTGVQALGLGCLTFDGFFPLQLKNAPKDSPNNTRSLLKDGDLLMSRSNTRELVGLVGIYRETGTPCIYPDLMMKLTPLPHCKPEYLEVVLRSSAVRRQVKASSQGTSESMAKINSSSVMNLKVKIPSLPDQETTLATLSSLRAKMNSTKQEKPKIAKLREGILADFMKG